VLRGAGDGQNLREHLIATAERLKAPMAHTSRGKDFVAHDNPYNVGMTGLIGQASGYHAVLDCDVLLGMAQRTQEATAADLTAVRRCAHYG